MCQVLLDYYSKHQTPSPISSFQGLNFIYLHTMAAALGQSMVGADVYQSANLRYSKGLSQLFSAGPRV
ncbi:hypothetical protein NC651_009965 [Populus alba x Populus x berolinensis]|nr:hypothetical protein NC651_009965 [Populus alba x Populus x berolinensis]